MQMLVERATAYAADRGIEVLIVDGPASGRYAVIRAGSRTILCIDAGTAASAACGDVIYRACEAIVLSRSLQINLHRAVSRIAS